MRLSIPSEPQPLEPKPEDPRLREQSLLLALRDGCRVLVQDGLDCLRRPWNRWPNLRLKLWEEGVQLRRLLIDTPISGLRGLVQRGCDWFARVHMTRARYEGREVPEPVRRIREMLMSDNPNGTPPGNRELAKAVLVLAEAVADNSAAVAENSQAMVQLRKDLDAFRKETNARFDGMDDRFDGVDRRLDGIDGRLDGIDAEPDIDRTLPYAVQLSDLTIMDAGWRRLQCGWCEDWVWSCSRYDRDEDDPGYDTGLINCPEYDLLGRTDVPDWGQR